MAAANRRTAVMVGVIVAENLKLDGERYEIGELLEIAEGRELETLLAVGAVKLPTDAGGGPEMTVTEAIVELAARVAAGDITEGDAYIQSGAPDRRALEEILGRDVSAGERDAAWAQVQKAAGAGGGSQE